MEGLIDVSKLSMDKFEEKYGWFNIHETISEVFGMLDYLSMLHNTKMSFSISQPKEIYSDSTRIKQILINLVSNSLKFTIDGNIKVRVFYEESQGSDESSVLSNKHRFMQSIKKSNEFFLMKNNSSDNSSYSKLIMNTEG